MYSKMEQKGVFIFLATVVAYVNHISGMGLCEFETKFPGATYSCYDNNGCDAIFHFGWNNSCYFISEHELLQPESVDYCIAYGTHLVFIETEEEQEAIVHWVSFKSRDYWIGLAGRTAMDVSWLSGKPLNYTNFVHDSFNENSGFYRLTTPYYQWHDRYSTYMCHFICEKELDSSNDSNTFISPSASGCILFDDESERLVLYNSTKSRGLYPEFTEAQFSCGDSQELIGEQRAHCLGNEWNGVGHCAENVALHKPAYQSSNYSTETGLASYAVDGGTSGIWIDYTCTHTRNSGETNPWLTVDLAGTFNIGLIRVYNRVDGDLGYRLVGADVIVTYGDNETVVATLGYEIIAPPTDIPVDMVVGTHVTLYLKGDYKILTVCELEIYGVPAKLSQTDY